MFLVEDLESDRVYKVLSMVLLLCGMLELGRLGCRVWGGVVVQGSFKIKGGLGFQGLGFH